MIKFVVFKMLSNESSNDIRNISKSKTHITSIINEKVAFTESFLLITRSILETLFSHYCLYEINFLPTPLTCIKSITGKRLYLQGVDATGSGRNCYNWN